MTAGCLSVGVAALPQSRDTGAKSLAAIPDPLLVRGVARLGEPGTSTLAGNSGAALIGNAGSGLIGNAGSGFTSAAPLSGVAAFTSAAPLTGIEALSGAPPIGIAKQFWILTRSVQAGETGLYVEAIDLATAERVAFSKATSSGAFTLQIPFSDFKRALVVQVTGLNGGIVTSYLASDFPVEAGKNDTASLAVTPGSTVIAFADALVAGIRSEMRVERGFRGFRTGQLAFMVAAKDGAAIAKAAATLDTGSDLRDVRDPHKALQAIVNAAEELALKALGKALDVGGTGAELAGAMNLAIKAIPATPVDESDTATQIINKSADNISNEAVIAEAARVSGGLGNGSIRPTPTPTEGGTPAPGESASPSVSPAPGATGSVNPSSPPATDSPSPDVSPSATSSVSPSASPSATPSTSPSGSPTAAPTPVPTAPPGSVQIPGSQIPGSGDGLSDLLDNINKTKTPTPTP